jgi:transposase
MPEAEFAELVADIKKNGLITAIVTAADGSILDGWHRYRACIASGVKPRFEPFAYVIEPAAEVAGQKMTEAEFVISQNAHRRHLTRDQKRNIVVGLLKAKPEASDRAIAEQAKVSDKTVGTVRRELEATAEIPQLTETKGKDGKTRAKQKQRAIRKLNSEIRALNKVIARPVEPQANPPRPSLEKWQAFMVETCGWTLHDRWVLRKESTVKGINLIASSRGDGFVSITARETNYDPKAKLPEAIFNVEAEVQFNISKPENIAYIEKCIVDAAAALARAVRPAEVPA